MPDRGRGCAPTTAGHVEVGATLQPQSARTAVLARVDGGAVLASLADTLMLEAFERGRPFNAMATAVGFLLAFVLAVL